MTNRKILFLKWFVWILFPSALVFLSFLAIKNSFRQPKSILQHNNPSAAETKQDPLIITLQPLEFFPEYQLQLIKQEVAAFYKGSKVQINRTLPMPASAWYEPRKRYISDSLLEFLYRIKSIQTDLLIGLTQKDIATEKGNNPNYGIMGQGYCPGSVCVVSSFRLNKKIPANVAESNKQKFINERLVKVCLHELGHNLGLPHCSFADSCLMHDADGTIAQVDKERKFICKNCRSKLSIQF